MTDRYFLSPFFLDEPLHGLEALAESGWEVNRPVLPESATQSRMSAVHKPLAYRVGESLKQGERPIVVAGDCCTAIAVHAGFERAGLVPTLVWLDAHGDFNTWETTPSGFLGGMPLAMLAGLGDQTLMRAVSHGTLPQERIVLSDARDLDPAERELLAASSLTRLADVGRLLTADLPEGPLWIHFDADLIDPSDAPGVAYPAPGGSSALELEKIFRELARSHEIAAISFSTWSPELDADGRTRQVCLQLLNALIGGRS